jgi:molybdopterin molybdotransferase
MILNFEQALSVVEEKVLALKQDSVAESVPLLDAQDRILAEEVRADRDYPPFDRSMRDGYAVRASDVSTVSAELRILGEIHAGSFFPGEVGPGQCASIMTGAPLPRGADAVVMVEHTEPAGPAVRILRPVQPFENVARQASEASAGSLILSPGKRLGAAEIGLLASVGLTEVKVFRRPRVAILSTGDEVVSISQTPEWFEIRNSNAMILAAETVAAGGYPVILDIARDNADHLRQLLREGLNADLLLTSGGVSAGKHDLVEEVLGGMGAEFFFDGVELRPGRPLVFGAVRGKLFFGLPGNPVSTYVTCALFARPAIHALGGGKFRQPLFLRARLAHAVSPKARLTLFMPAKVSRQASGPVVELAAWQGSGDLAGLAAANCFLVLHPGQTPIAPGEWVDVMLKAFDG